ncbi:MAG: hypothetical protein K0S98_2723, partial [Propionibacteriaceae bacterium]|nr:hypothetical protein [Propionibacteriaceae bacterium]
MSNPLHYNGRTVRLLTVNPKLAQTWLDTVNTRNRTINPRRVDEHARAMMAGAWVLSNDAITFDTDGKLLNGQHRLSAVVKSNTKQVFVVVEGADPEDQNIMDSGMARRAGQQLHIAGWKNGSTVAAIARVLLRWNTGSMLTAYRPTIQEIAIFAGTWPTRLEVATEHAMRVCRRIELNRALVGALAFTAYGLAASEPERLTVEQVAEFFQLLETGANMPADHPVMVLRDRATRYRRERIKQPEAAQLYDLVRTWNAY